MWWAAVATSTSHKIGDGRSSLNIINKWATVTTQSSSRDQEESPLISPHIICHQARRNTNFLEISSYKSRVGCVTRSFLFTNQKLNDLKAKVTAMTVESGQPIMNPTRVEVLTWLLHKCAVTAATKTNSGTFKASDMTFPIDMRNILVEKLPGKTLGNILMMINFPTSNQNEMAPNMIIHKLKNKKIQLQSISNMKALTSIIADMPLETALEMSRRLYESYVYSSLCRFPTYGIYFGWGKPVKVTIGGTVKNTTISLDTPNNDGIEAIVCLENEDMKAFQNDPDLVAFC
ncbi:deacetylvindoline O-acetyltransferase [Tanacetum coccineum]